MSARRLAVGIVMVLLALAGGSTPGCGGGGSSGTASGPTIIAAAGGPRASSPIALSGDDRWLLAVNPDLDTVSLFDATTDALAVLGQLPVGAEPRSVAIQPDGTKAYVANAGSGTVSVLSLDSLTVTATIAVGTEPVALALSPNGTRLYVANMHSSSVSVVNTATDAVIATVAIPAATGRAPRAIAITNDGDGDDADETVYVALFFGERRTGKTGLDEGQDDQREGRVVAISGSTNAITATIVLGPLADSGFTSNGSVLDFVSTANGVTSTGTNAPDPTNPAASSHVTGCFPNQLAAIALHPTSPTGFAYVVSTAASPNGPFGFNFNTQGLVSVFNTATGSEITAASASATVHQRAPLNLNRGIRQDTTNVERFFLTNPVAMAWRPDGSEAWVVVQQADLLVRLTIDSVGVPTVNAPLGTGGAAIARVDLQAPGGSFLPGKAPRGIAINRAGDRGYVYCFVTRSVSAVDLDARTVVGTARSAPLPAAGTPEATVQLGAELFFAGRGPGNRMSSEAWGACIVCHPDGLADGVTHLFPAGPRQTIPLDGMFARSNTTDQRILNFSALRDETQDFELNSRNVFGGRGLIDDDRAVFAIGGASGATPTDSSAIEQYEQATAVVGSTNGLAGAATLPAILTGRRDFGMATLPDGRIFIMGGRTGAAPGTLVTGLDAVLEFDPLKNVVRRRNTTGFTPRCSLGAVAVVTSAGSRVYAVGGYDTIGGSPVATVEEYNPSADTWRSVDPLPAANAEFGIAVSGPLNKGEPFARIHVLGGNTGTEAAPTVTGTAHRFTPSPTTGGTWSTAAFTITPRRNLGAAAVVRGVFPFHIFAIGGRDAGGNALPTVEAFVGTTSQTTSTLPTSLVATTLTALPEGRHSFGIGTSVNRIYVMGGVTSGADVATILEYNPGANPAAGPAGAPATPAGVWSSKGSLQAARRGFQVSSPPPVMNLLPPSSFRSAEQDALAEWVKRTVRSAVAPNRGSAAAAVTAGRTLFGQDALTGSAGVSCATCHGGPKWTRSTVDFVSPPSPDLTRGAEEIEGAELRKTFSQPGDTTVTAVLINVGTFVGFTSGRNIEARFNPADVGNRVNALGVNGFNIPSLLSVHATAPYLHNGMAGTLEEVLNGSFDGNGSATFKSVHNVTSATDRANLIEFLKAIDETQPTFP